MLGRLCYSLLDEQAWKEERDRTIHQLITLADGARLDLSNPNLGVLVNGRCPGVTIEASKEKGKVGNIYLIRSVPASEVLVLKEMNYSNSSISQRALVTPKEVSSFSPCRVHGAGDMKFDCESCVGALRAGTKLVGTEEYVNELLIGYIIHNILERANIRSICTLYQYGGVYNGRGYTIMEYADLGNLSSQSLIAKYSKRYNITDVLSSPAITLKNVIIMDESVVKGVISQVVMAIHYLGYTLQFSSNDLKPENLLCYLTPSKGSYRGTTGIESESSSRGSLDLTCPFTVKISDLGKSSITIQTAPNQYMRLYNRSISSSIYSSLASFKPKVTRDKLTQLTYYVVDDTFITSIYTWMRHTGHPYYRSFDYYTFMISLLTIPAYYFAFFSSESLLKTFWHPMWMSDQEGAEMQRLIHSRIYSPERTGLGESIDMLRGKRLICDTVDAIVNGSR
jgi:hypothetical protein